MKTFSKFGKNISVNEIRTILKQHDYDSSGKIEFDEFKAMLLDDLKKQ